MFFSNWRSLFAIAGIIGAACLASYFAPWITRLARGDIPGATQIQNRAAPHGNHEAAPLQTQQPSNRDWRPSFYPAEPYAPYQNTNCQSPKDHEEADLCQQWRVAEATEKAVALAESQYSWNIAQAVGTLLAAFAAAYAALKAGEAASTAEQALRGLERPYLFVEVTAANLRHSLSGPPHIQYAIRNYGKLPAILRSISISLRYNPSFPLVSTEAIARREYAVIKPYALLVDKNKKTNFRLDVADAVAGQSFYGGVATLLVLHAIIQYEDATGGIHTDSFCLRGTERADAFRIDDCDREYNWRKTTYPT